MAKRELKTNAVASSNDVSALNRVRVLEALMHAGPASRVSIARETGMSPATVNRLTASLMKLGLVSQAGNDESTGGRPSMLVQMEPRQRTILALDLCENSVEVALLDITGRVIERATVSAKDTQPEEKLNILVDTVEEWSSQQGAALAAVGISAPGPVTDEGRVLVAPALDWYDVDVLPAVQKVTRAPITVENDVNLIAYAEHCILRHAAPETRSLALEPTDSTTRGNGGTSRTLVALAVFQGVGAGVVEDGRLWRGMRGAAGQFGRMLRDVSGLRHKKYGFGHLESELGSEGILQRAINARVVSPEVDSADAVFSAAQEGDPEALAMVESVADEYAFHLVNVCAMIAPDVVVFGGLFERWSELLIPLIRSRLEGNVIHLPELRTAHLGDEGKLIGAGLYALEQAGGLVSLVVD